MITHTTVKVDLSQKDMQEAMLDYVKKHRPNIDNVRLVDGKIEWVLDCWSITIMIPITEPK